MTSQLRFLTDEAYNRPQTGSRDRHFHALLKEIMNQQHTTERRPRISGLQLGAALAVFISGLSVGVYALTAFAAPDWAVAGPGLLVAGAGIVGLRFRVALLAGVIPLGAILSIAGPVIAFDLARPNETPYFLGSLLALISSCFATALGVTAVAFVDRGSPKVVAATGLGASFLFTIALLGLVPAMNAASEAPKNVVTKSKASAIEVEMIDFAFIVKDNKLSPSSVLLLRNTGSLPHNLTIPKLGIDVFVPSGRKTYVRVVGTTPVTFFCAVGDHQDQGMAGEFAFFR
jgi:hypothetical protein